MLLVFYPADNSPVCTQQLRSYSEDLNEFEKLGAAVLCLSPQDVASHEAFAAAQALRLPLLSDADKAVGQAYGILGPLGFYRRSVFVVDRDGVIRFARRSLSNLTYLPTDELVEAIRAAETERRPTAEPTAPPQSTIRVRTALLASNECSPWVSIPACPAAATARCGATAGGSRWRPTGI